MLLKYLILRKALGYATAYGDRFPSLYSGED